MNNDNYLEKNYRSEFDASSFEETYKKTKEYINSLKKGFQHEMINGIVVKIYSQSGQYPEYQTEGSSGMDIRAFISESITIGSLERALIPTGIYIELPMGYEAQIRPRSGLALKKGITIPNSPATIDADYRGEIGVILLNLSKDPLTIEPNERIAQMILAKTEYIVWDKVDSPEEFSKTERLGGFGSTGTK